MWLRRRLRYIVKSLTYKTLSVLITFFAGWLLTGDPRIGLTLGVIEVTLKLAVYYAHEEVWHKINFGRKNYKKVIKKEKLIYLE